MEKFKKFVKIFAAVAALIVVFMAVLDISAYIIGFTYDSKNIAYQNSHLEYLKNEYYTDSYTPCDEQKLASFDIQQAFEDGVKLNELAVIGTHNSYQLLTNTPKRLLKKIIKVLSFGLDTDKTEFEMDTLTVQLEHGVRKFELDLQTVDKDGDISFIVTHDPITDSVTSCYNLEKTLEEISLWSDNNPGHLPVYLLIEPKADLTTVKNIKNFNIAYALELDKLIKEALGDRLLTPAQALGNFESFIEMRTADSWPTLKECAGKIIVLFHPNAITQEYINTDSTIKTQAMFPVLGMGSADETYASFILNNDANNAAQQSNTVKEKKLMVRTRADEYPHFSDDRYAQANASGAQIVTTDYPPRTVREKDHTYSFDGYMFKLVG